jgi:hypothetical protein
MCIVKYENYKIFFKSHAIAALFIGPENIPKKLKIFFGVSPIMFPGSRLSLVVSRLRLNLA